MKKVLLTGIFLAAAAIRLIGLSLNPPSMSWDEVSIGYNAYSILQTGKDEHGNFLPLDAFIAYGDYKPPLSIYLTVPFVALFGPTKAAVRLPSVLSGILAVYLVFLIGKQFFGDKSPVPVLASGILAFSPWHIMLSRAGFEANIALTVILWGVYLVLKSREKSGFLYIMFVPFVLAVYTFNSARYFAPVLLLILLIAQKKTVVSNVKRITVGGIIAFMFLLPILPHLFSKEARLRFEEVSIFNDYPLIYHSNERIKLDDFSLFSRIIHNRRVVYTRSYLLHFFDHFEPRYLFIRGDGNPKFSTQDTGQLYLADALFLVPGLFFLLKNQKKISMIFLFWLVLAIAPAAVARETPHALRTLNSLPVFVFFTAAGISGFLSMISGRKRTAAVFAVSVLYVFNTGYFLHTYFVHYPKEFSGEWQYGYREAIRFAEEHKNSYDTIVLSDVIGRPYMYTLFYGKYRPEFFWDTKEDYFDAAGFYHVDGFGKYRFTKDASESYAGNVLYILPSNQVPKNANVLENIKLLNGDTKLVVFEV